MLALVASAAASVATLVQTHTNGTQLSASVWPYLTVDKQFDARRLKLGFANQGLGPALVRTFALSVDGRAERRWSDVVARLDARRRFRVAAERDFGGGSVLRPGEAVDLATIVGAGLSQPQIDAAFGRMRDRVLLFVTRQLLVARFAADRAATGPVVRRRHAGRHAVIRRARRPRSRRRERG